MTSAAAEWLKGGSKVSPRGREVTVSTRAGTDAFDVVITCAGL